MWFYLKVGMTLLTLAWIFRMIERPDRPFPVGAKILAVLLSLRPVMGDLSHGNVNLFILFLVAGSMFAFHKKRDFLSGVVLALAIACKVTPALLVGYFLWKRAWTALGGVIVGLVLFLVVVPGLFLGMRENLELFGSWFDQMVKPYVLEGVVTPEHNNQSLPGLVTRMTTHSPSFSTYVDGVYTPVTYHNVIDVSPAVARWVVKGCMGLFVLLVIWTCRTPTTQRQGWQLAAEFALVVLGMLLFSERTWKHHCVTFVVPFAVLSYYLFACHPGRRMKWYLIGTLTAVVLLMTSTSTSLPGWQQSAKLAQVYGAYVWCYLLMIAALLVILRHGEGQLLPTPPRDDSDPWPATRAGRGELSRQPAAAS